MGILKISTLNNFIKFVSNTGEIQAYGRNDVEARTNETEITFYHKEKKYLKFDDTSNPLKEVYALGDIRDAAGAVLPSVGTIQEDVISFLSDKISNFKLAGGGTASTITTDTSDDQEVIFDNAGVLDGSPKLKWNDATRELGISKDQSISATAKIAMGANATSILGGTAKIEIQGNFLYIGSSNINPASEKGLKLSITTIGANANKIIPNIDNNISFGDSGFRFSAGYINNLQSLTGLFSNYVAIGTSPIVFSPSSILGINSTTGGFLLPRVTNAERNAFVYPRKGLLVYNTDNNQFEYNTENVQTSGLLVVGKVYTFYGFQIGDDFTNVGAAVQSTGQSFTATGTTPTTWTNGSALGVASENWVGLSSTANNRQQIELTKDNDGRVFNNNEWARVDSSNATGGILNLYLPALSISPNYQIWCNKADSSTNIIRVHANGSDLIEGSSYIDITIDNEATGFMSYSTEWVTF